MFQLTIVLCIYVIITFLAQIILHEAGHFIFGKLSGFRFLSFRIFQFTILKKDKSYEIRKYSSMGSYGQCNMLPPDRENYPFVGLICGGILMNLISACMATAVMICPLQISFETRLGFILFAFYGYGMAFINAVPMKSAGVVNDGAVYLDLYKDSYARECYKKQLLIMADLIKGESYGEISYDLLKVPREADLTNSLIGYQKILECYYFMDLRDWSEAKNCLNAFYSNIDKIPLMIRNIVLAEDLFIRIKLGDSTVKESSMYDGIKRLLKKGKGDYNTIRVSIANELFVNSDIDKGKMKNNIQRFGKKYLFRGEAKFCESLIAEMLNIL